MITVTFFKNGAGKPGGFRCEGHAGYAEAGKDLVCSAVSMLVINTVNSIATFTENDISLTSDEKTGLIELRFKSDPDGFGVLLVKAMKLGLESVIGEYGDEFLKIQNG